MYGYEGDSAMSSKQIEKRIAELKKEIGSGKDRYNSEAKIFLDSIYGLLTKDISKEIQANLNKLTRDNENAGILNGKIKENEKYLEKALAMEEKSGVSVFSLGEYDSTRLALNRQYVEVRQSTSLLNNNINLHLKKLLNLKKGSAKRRKAIDEFGNLIAQMMNKNMLMLHIIGAIRENQYYIDSVKLNFQKAGGGR
jgi:hypothetical protein